MPDDHEKEPEELYLDLWEEHLRLLAADYPIPAPQDADD